MASSWRGVVESTDCVGLFDSTFTVSCVDRSAAAAAVRTNKVARAGQSSLTHVVVVVGDDDVMPLIVDVSSLTHIHTALHWHELAYHRSVYRVR